jgi:hypothetical protein
VGQPSLEELYHRPVSLWPSVGLLQFWGHPAQASVGQWPQLHVEPSQKIGSLCARETFQKLGSQPVRDGLIGPRAGFERSFMVNQPDGLLCVEKKIARASHGIRNPFVEQARAFGVLGLPEHLKHYRQAANGECSAMRSNVLCSER